MKKLRYSSHRRSQEQPQPLEVGIFAEQQQHAKSGNVSAVSGADALIKSIGDAAPVVDTLAGITRAALGNAALTKKAIINFATRKVTIVPSATNIATVTGHTGLGVYASFTKDDATKSTTAWTGVPNDADDPHNVEVTDVANVTSKPSISGEALVNKVEDILNDPLSGLNQDGKSLLAVIDQTDGSITFYAASVANIAAVDGAALLAEDAEFAQTLVGAGGAQFFE